MNAPVQVTDDGDLRVEVPPLVPLGEALARWTHEARRGVCQTGRYRCSYFVWGSGPPLVFIHGLCDVGRSFVPVMELLKRRFTCIAYELPDGTTDQARLSRYTHPQLVADLFALLDALRLNRVDLLGSSFGSTIALAAMAQQPSRFHRAVLQGGFAIRPLALWERAICSFCRYLPGPMGTLPFRDAMLHHPIDVAVFRDCAPEMWEFLRENSNAPPKAAVARRGLMVSHIDLRPSLPSIKQPVLMICGDRDPIVRSSCEQPLLEGLPNVERVEFPHCGHFPQYTHAALTAELIRQFLEAPDCLTAGCPH